MRDWIRKMSSVERDEIYVWDDIIGEKVSSEDELVALQEWLKRCYGLAYGIFENVTYYAGRMEFKKYFVCLRVEKNNDNIGFRTVRVLFPIDWIKEHIKIDYAKWHRSYTLEEATKLYEKGEKENILLEIKHPA